MRYPRLKSRQRRFKKNRSAYGDSSLAYFASYIVFNEYMRQGWTKLTERASAAPEATQEQPWSGLGDVAASYTNIGTPAKWNVCVSSSLLP